MGDDVVIGSVHLLVDPARGMAELACLIARQHWTQGYGILREEWSR